MPGVTLAPTRQMAFERLKGLDDYALNGKKVLVTSPLQYAPKLTARIVQKGGRPVWVPSIQVSPLKDFTKLDSTLMNLQDYSHLLFTSKNGISAVLSRLAQLTSEDEAIRILRNSGVRIYALGSDAEVLRAVGLTNVLTPLESSTQGLVRHLVANGELKPGARICCPVPQVVDLVEPEVVPKFLDALVLAGTKPERVDSYLTGPGATAEQCSAEREMLVSGQIDAIVFSSSAEAQGLVSIMTKKVIREAVAKGTVLASHGPYTAKGVTRVLDLPVEVIGKDFSSFDGVVNALEDHFAMEDKKKAV